jgi:hypothetical protein
MSEAIQIYTKFDTCKHRSIDPIKKLIKRCSCKGGDYEQEGFFCLKRQVFNINHQFCSTCEEYESK